MLSATGQWGSHRNDCIGGEFGWSVGWRLGLFALLTLGFPFIVYGVAAATHCSSSPGACGAIALVTSFYLRPVIVLGFLALMIGPLMARMRALGLPGFVGLIAIWLLLLDVRYLMVLGAHWSFAFSIGAIYMELPAYLILALTLIAAMAVVREPQSEGDSLWQRHGRFGKATLGGVVAVAVIGLLPIFFFSLAVRGMVGHSGKAGLGFMLTAYAWGSEPHGDRGACHCRRHRPHRLCFPRPVRDASRSGQRPHERSNIPISEGAPSPLAFQPRPASRGAGFGRRGLPSQS